MVTNKLKGAAITVANKCKESAPSIATACMCMGMMMCHASGVSTIFDMVFSLLSKAMLAIGVMIAIMGVVSYTTADDDGPQKKKGATQIGSAIALIALGGSLAAWGDRLASVIGS